VSYGLLKCGNSNTEFKHWAWLSFYIKECSPAWPTHIASTLFIRLQHCPRRIRRMPVQVCCRLLIILHTLAMPYPCQRLQFEVKLRLGTRIMLRSRTSDFGLDAVVGHKQRVPFLFMAMATATNTSVYSGSLPLLLRPDSGQHTDCKRGGGKKKKQKTSA